jgi:hypothetical protein
MVWLPHVAAKGRTGFYHRPEAQSLLSDLQYRVFENILSLLREGEAILQGLDFQKKTFSSNYGH